MDLHSDDIIARDEEGGGNVGGGGDGVLNGVVGEVVEGRVGGEIAGDAGPVQIDGVGVVVLHLQGQAGGLGGVGDGEMLAEIAGGIAGSGAGDRGGFVAIAVAEFGGAGGPGGVVERLGPPRGALVGIVVEVAPVGGAPRDVGDVGGDDESGVAGVRIGRGVHAADADGVVVADRQGAGGAPRVSSVIGFIGSDNGVERARFQQLDFDISGDRGIPSDGMGRVLEEGFAAVGTGHDDGVGGQAELQGHGGAGGADVGHVEARGGAAPPVGVRGGIVIEGVGIGGRGVTQVIEILRVAAVGIALEMPEVVGLDESDLVVGVAGVGKHALVVLVAEFVDMPDGDARGGDVRVAAGFAAVFEQEILGGGAGFGVAEDFVIVGVAHGGDQGAGEAGGAGEVGGGGPAGRALEVGANEDRVGAVTAGVHQAEAAGPADRVVVVVINVRIAAKHVAVFMAEGAEREGAADVGDLVFGNLLAAAGKFLGRGQGPRVGPEAVGPHAAIAAGIKDIAGHDPVAAVHRQGVEGGEDFRGVIRQGLHDVDGIVDQQPALDSGVDAGIVVEAFRLRHAEVGGDGIGVGQEVVGVVPVVCLDRAVVAVSGVIVAIAKVDDVGLGDGGGVIGEVDQQGESDLVAGGGE